MLLNPDGSPTTGDLTDLYMLKHTLGDDLALEAGSLTISPDNAAPGAMVTIQVTARNRGDKVAENVLVNFYKGDPAGVGVLIGTTVIDGLLRPGDSRVVTLPWVLPSATTPVNLFAVIDPFSAVDVINRADNVASVPIMQPDLVVQTIGRTLVARNRYNVIVTVANNGATGSAASQLELRLGSELGPLLATLTVPAVPAFSSVDVAFDWDTTAITQPEVDLLAIADVSKLVAESSELNNTLSVHFLVPQFQPPSAVFKPTALAFAAQHVGSSSAAQAVSLTNTGGDSLTISSLLATPGVFGLTHDCGVTLNAGASCGLSVTFTPIAAGTRVGSITLTSNTAGSAPSVVLTGTGVASNVPICTLSAAPASIRKNGTSILTASCSPAATTYSWTGGTCAGVSINTCTVTPALTTTYGVTGTNGYGAGSASATVTLKAVDLTPILMLLLD